MCVTVVSGYEQVLKLHCGVSWQLSTWKVGVEEENANSTVTPGPVCPRTTPPSPNLPKMEGDCVHVLHHIKPQA